MRVGSDLREKALLALEEAAQACRYGTVQRTYAIRFALAYLWSLRRGDRGCFGNFWCALDGDDQLYRFSNAERALIDIYRQLGVERPDEPARRFWAEAQERHRRASSGG